MRGKLFGRMERGLCLTANQEEETTARERFKMQKKKKKKKKWRDLPGGTVVKNPPANAGDAGSSPGLGRSHMPRSNEARAPQLLSLSSRAREPQLLSPHATATEARVPRAHVPQQREATTMRSPHTATKTQCSQNK